MQGLEIYSLAEQMSASCIDPKLMHKGPLEIKEIQEQEEAQGLYLRKCLSSKESP
jgi:hypothetical protein